MPDKRRRRKRDRDRPSGPEARASDAPVSGVPSSGAPLSPEAARGEAEWQWRTFPVGFAFSLGALVMGLLVWLAPGSFYIFLIGALFLTVFGVAHYFGRSFREYRAGDEER